MERKQLQKIEPPKNCPSCNSILEQSNDQLFCRSPSCGAQQYKAVEHFAKTLKIKGLGPASIQKLDIRNIIEIYELDEDEVAATLGNRMAEKLLLEIEASKKASLNKLLPAFGIPLIGKSASEKLCKVIKNIGGLTRQNCEKAGLGPKATQNLMNWLLEFDEMYDLPFDYVTEEVEEQEEIKGVVCISGRLKSYKTKAEAEQILKQVGYVTKSSITKDVTILVNESGIESSKTKRARESGITIINNINELI